MGCKITKDGLKAEGTLIIRNGKLMLATKCQSTFLPIALNADFLMNEKVVISIKRA